MYFMIARGLYLKRMYWTTHWDIKASSTNFLSFFAKEYFVKINSALVFHVLFFLITARAHNKVRTYNSHTEPTYTSAFPELYFGSRQQDFLKSIFRDSMNCLGSKCKEMIHSYVLYGFFWQFGIFFIVMVNVFSFTANRKLHLWQFCKLLHIRNCRQTLSNSMTIW